MSAVGAASAGAIPRPRTDVARESQRLRLVAFAALATFAVAHWSALVDDAPLGRLALVMLVAVVVAGALALLGRAGLPRIAVSAACALVAIVGVVLGLAAAGLPLALLDPRQWGELASDLDRGLAGIRTIQWPYRGEDEWVRLVVLLGAPALTVPAAVLAFWPARHTGALLRGLALTMLLVLYGVSVTEHEQGAPLLRGFALLLLMAAWLWLPRLRAREAAIAALVVVGVGLGALPVAAKLDASDALVDYRQWNLFGGRDVTFDWNHRYGPLDWPRDGKTLLNIKAKRPLYWKAEVLDNFDGLRWRRSTFADATQPVAELPDEPDERWLESFRVTVRALRTDFLVGAGTPLDVNGPIGEGAEGSSDGTVRAGDQPLARGDAYSVTAYVPDPKPDQLREARGRYPLTLDNYTVLALPDRGATALSPSAAPPPADTLAIPFRGRPRNPVIDDALRESPYARAYRLSNRLTRGAPTTYDAVKRVERYLNSSAFTYSENPPSHRYPLESFLFDDKLGYCQQFSGAMALLLRMQGIPTRVVSGFSPGKRDADSGEFNVRDLDAHSWVEVYFKDIGWVTFDPTPTSSPAIRTPDGPAVDATGAAGTATLGDGAAQARGLAGRDRKEATGGAAAGDSGPPAVWLVLALVVILLVAATAAAALLRRLILRRMPAEQATDAGLRELQRALPRLGLTLHGHDTLLSLERRLERIGGAGATGYISGLRSARFASTPAQAPGAAQRRALRRLLSEGGGIRRRMTGFVALPPGGPRLTSLLSSRF